MKTNIYKYILCILTFLSTPLSASDTDSSLVNKPKPQSESLKAEIPSKPTIVIIDVEGTVDGGMSAYISRALRDSREYPNRVIVLNMDTFGGQVDAAFQIVDTILNVRDAKTIAFVKTKAISAGALIALSCNELAMKPGTTIGDVAPLMVTNEGPKMLGEKFQSPLRAKFRTLAKKNGYPEKLTESMVTEGLVVYEVQYKDSVRYLDSAQLADARTSGKEKILSTKMVVRKGELLTMDDAEARRYGFSEMSVENIETMLDSMKIAYEKIVRIEQSWSEEFVRFIGTIAPILMMIGFAALYIEIKTPGFGAPGIIGIICLGLVFFSQYMAGLADHTELIIIILGLMLLIVEVFILPGFGVAGLAGIALILIGMILSFQDFVLPKPEFPWQQRELSWNAIKVLGSFIGSALLAVIFFRFIFPKLGVVVEGPYLTATLKDARIDTEAQQNIHVGDQGVALTALRPAGKMLFNHNPYDVVTEGDFIDKDTPLVVTQISGNRIVVSRRAS